MMKIISWKLWLPDHLFPSVAFLPLPAFAQIALLVLFFIVAFLILIQPLSRWLLLCLLLSETFSILGDELRWQPWMYQFLFIIFALFINYKKPKLAINSIILILASTYFFSGLQKINGGFLQNVWLRLVLVKFLHLPPSVYDSRVLRYAGLLVPLIEMASGILLLLPKQSKFYLLLPISIHVFVIVFLSPAGINFNDIVLPWNIAMALLVWVIFRTGGKAFSVTEIVDKNNVVIAFAWLLLPIAGLFGYWDRYFSSSVYSGNNRHLLIYPGDTSSVPSGLKPYLNYSKRGWQGLHYYISASDWCLCELGVPVPPQERICIIVEQEFVKKYGAMKPVFYYR